MSSQGARQKEAEAMGETYWTGGYANGYDDGFDGKAMQSTNSQYLAGWQHGKADAR